MTTAKINRQWVLARRPEGFISPSDFEYKEVPVPHLQEGEVLLKVLYLSFDPAQRLWIAEASYLSQIKIGEVVPSVGVGEVVESKVEGYSKGDLVSGFVGWQDYSIPNKESLISLSKLQPGITPEAGLSYCGFVGLTAYFGLLRIGAPKSGETLVISGAAGATGSIVGQIGKILGLRVIGIAGGEEKVKFLKEELHFDEAIDYKTENVFKRLKEIAPKGIDIFFDNVGGEILDAFLGNLAPKARIIACGNIASYNDDQVPGLKNFFNLIIKGAKIEGFAVFHFASEFAEASQQLFKWHEEGKLKEVVDVKEGFKNIPDTLIRIFKGGNLGKQLLKLD